MKTILIKCMMVALSIGVLSSAANAQVRKRSVKKRSTVRNTATSTNPAATPTVVDTAIVQAPPPDSLVDSLPIANIKPSLRPETALDEHNGLITDRTPLPYQQLRAEDAAYDERIWR